MPSARFTTPDHTGLLIEIADGETFGGLRGPLPVNLPWPGEGNTVSRAVEAAIAAGTLTVAAYVAPPEPVPASISDRQFAQALADRGTISRAEALAFVRTGTIPAALEAAIAAITDEDARFAVEIAVSGATTFERNHPATLALAAALGWSAEETDALWRAATLIP